MLKFGLGCTGGGDTSLLNNQLTINCFQHCFLPVDVVGLNLGGVV